MTQLYVSVDASTKESLKRIDRPLFRDFWPRFINSLEALAEKVSHFIIILGCQIFLPTTFTYSATHEMGKGRQTNGPASIGHAHMYV